jgi:hypothetical protein
MLSSRSWHTLARADPLLSNYLLLASSDDYNVIPNFPSRPLVFPPRPLRCRRTQQLKCAESKAGLTISTPVWLLLRAEPPFLPTEASLQRQK